MRTPYPMISPTVPVHTATQALQVDHGKLYVAIGVMLLLTWFLLHRFAAHRHPVVEWFAKAFLAAAGLTFAVSVGVIAKWVANANNATANWLTSRTGDPTFANDHLGFLTVLAIIDVVFAVSVTADTIKHLRQKGGSGRVSYHPRWGTMEDLFNKYGWFGLGPLSATLPGQLGLWVVTLLTLLSEELIHIIGPVVGLA